MSTPSPSDKPTHRLLDMVVQEVSLVDRAANQRRFLIVKRNHAMADTFHPSPSEGSDLTRDTHLSTPSGESDLEATESSSEETPPSRDNRPTSITDMNDWPEEEEEDTQPSPTAWAAQALEALTEIVEVLGTVPREETQTQAIDLARELHTLATRLEGVSGGIEKPTANEGPETATLNDALTAIRSTLGRVGQVLKRPPPKRPKPAASEQPLLAKLDHALAKLQGIGLTLQEQQQRLARVEKRFGLPNSTPVGEQPQTIEVETGWPLDLNQPRDRDSVEKAVSFHDA